MPLTCCVKEAGKALLRMVVWALPVAEVVVLPLVSTALGSSPLMRSQI